jgi:RNA polymerase sigma factor (sigma-70 family)
MTTHETELKALMLASLDGDGASHRALLERLSRHLRAYYKSKLARIGRGAAEAEDLVQEAVLAIHLKRHTYDPAELLTPWVHAIARYKLIDFLRRTRSSLADVPIDEADNIMAHDDNVDAESTYDVRRLMERLPKNMRCAIEAVKLDGQSIAEAAEVRHLGVGSKSEHSPGAQGTGRLDCPGDQNMKTDDLVAALSAHIEPVNRRLLSRTVYIALAAGTVVAFGIMLIGLGVRADLMTARALIFLLLKLAFTVGIVGVASVYLTRLARPGGERRTSSISAAMPFAAIVLLAVISLGLAPSSHWNKMVMGDEWLECLLSIPIIAIVPFAVIIAAVRRAAPTNLARTGAVAGLVAGGVSAMAYALCTDDSLPFVAAWYGGTIVLCTLAGAALGPRLLRW